MCVFESLQLVALQPTLALAYRQHFPRRSKSKEEGAAKNNVAKDHSKEGEEEKAKEEEEEDDSRRCFHVLGFDVLLDHQGNPHLLEVTDDLMVVLKNYIYEKIFLFCFKHFFVLVDRRNFEDFC